MKEKKTGKGLMEQMSDYNKVPYRDLSIEELTKAVKEVFKYDKEIKTGRDHIKNYTDYPIVYCPGLPEGTVVVNGAGSKTMSTRNKKYAIIKRSKDFIK